MRFLHVSHFALECFETVAAGLFVAPVVFLLRLGFRSAEHQQSARLQGVVKDRQQAFLQIRIQIDHQVAAGEQVEPGERRVFDEVLRREDRQLADFFADAIGAVVVRKIPVQRRGRNIDADTTGILSAAGSIHGFAIQIGAEDLHG